MVTSMLNALILTAIVIYNVREVKAGCDDKPLPHTTCERSYEKVGAYKDNRDDRALSEPLINDRDCGSDKNDGHRLNWYQFEESIHSLACRCAEKAREKGYLFFGLQYYGECWSGPSSDNYEKHGKASLLNAWQLIGNPPPPCDPTNVQECVGAENVNYVYRLKAEPNKGVDGGYSSWSKWTSCSKTCGGGQKGRERTCTNPKPDGDGKDCSSLGPSEESVPCNTQACPDPDIDGKWSAWKPWSSCSVTCGGGVRVRERECNNPAPSGHGKKCEGDDRETGQCAQEPCPIACTKALDIGIIIDESGSVGNRNFGKALAFVKELITHFKVSPKGTHFGIITYAGNARTHLTMADSSFYDFRTLKAKVLSIRYAGGWTRTDKALEMASSTLFTAAGGDRPDKANILIVFTDGKTNPGSKPYPEVLRPLQENGVRVIAVGIGRRIDDSELLEIAMDDPNFVIRIDGFENLKSILNPIRDDSCKGPVPPTLKPECTEDGLPLGIQNRNIKAASLSASSFWSNALGVNMGRLNGKASWAARYNDMGQYYQVDFGKPVKIAKILTQGRYKVNQWVTSYWLSYSQDNGVYEPYVHEDGKGKVIFKGNSDSNTVKSNKLVTPIFARFLRLHPLTWYSHISLRLEVYGCTKGFNPPVPPTCLSALGLQSGAVPDAKMTASSRWSSAHSPGNARLYYQKTGGRNGAWTAKYNNAEQWLQVDFGKMTKVRMVGTQGRSDADQWIVNYWISYSRDGVFWQKTDIFVGNSDRYKVERNLIDPPIYGRYFRIHPKQYHKHVSLRVEFYGCTSGKDFAVPKMPCLDALGMKNKKIPDSSITASSFWSNGCGPERARLDTRKSGSKQGSWCSKRNDDKQWLQVKLNKISQINSVVTQGRQDADQWVKSFSLQYSLDGVQYIDFQRQESILGNNDRNTHHGIILDPPIIARYIKVLPKTWNSHISMRVEIYGCTSGFPPPPSPVCFKALGVESKAIKDSQMTASSRKSIYYRASNGRLNFKKTGFDRGCWSAGRNDHDQWLGVDLGQVTKVTMFATQRCADHEEWVQSYKLSYSLDGYKYKIYTIKKQEKVFGGNSDKKPVVAHRLHQPIFARYVRVIPDTYHKHISMRVEFYGCTKGFVPPPLPECLEPLGLENGLVQDGQMSASSKWSQSHRASNARLNFLPEKGRVGGWVSRTNKQNQWLQVDFLKRVEIVGVATQGREEYKQWVKSYSIAYSNDGIFWRDYISKQGENAKLFKGNENHYGVVRHMLVVPIITRFVRIKPKEWYRRISMRAEFYGCRTGFPPAPVCSDPVHLSKWMMSSSTRRSSSLGPEFGIIGSSGEGSWVARNIDKNQWLQVTFDHEMRINRILTQGRQSTKQFVKTFSMEYSKDGVNFLSYELNGAIKIFQANTDSVVRHEIKAFGPIEAIAIRFRPIAWHGLIAMRVALYGCPTGKKPVNPPCRNPMDVGIIMDRSGSITPPNFKKSQNFVMKMISHFRGASSGTRFGVLAYGIHASLIFDFKARNQNSLTLENLVYGIRYTAEVRTRTDRALSVANTHLFSSRGGYLSNRPNVLFVLTDGKTSPGSASYRSVLQPLWTKKVKVIAVGIGKNINGKELLEMANNKKEHVFHANDFRSLSSLLDDILKASCPP